MSEMMSYRRDFTLPVYLPCFFLSGNRLLALSQARNLLRRSNLSGDLTDDCVNNFMSLNKSPNRAMCSSL